MRLLLDECIPKRLDREFTEHDFDVFITVDQSLRFQQNVSGFAIAVVVLEARSNDIEDLRPLVPRVRALLAELRPRQVIRVSGEVGG